jgi:hypothetical protein
MFAAHLQATYSWKLRYTHLQASDDSADASDEEAERKEARMIYVFEKQ